MNESGSAFVRIKLFDVVAAVLSVGAVVATGFIGTLGTDGASQVVIESDGGDYIYPIDQDRMLEIAGPLGVTVIQIADGTVAVISSPCRDKICIAAGALGETGQWSACLPNRVFVTVAGDSAEDEGVDAQTY